MLVAVEIENELHCSCVVVTHCSGCLYSRAAYVSSDGLADVRGGLLHDFLVSTLDRAISLIQMDIVPMSVAEDLHLNVSRSGDILLYKDSIVTESLSRLSLATFQGLHELLR